MPIKLVFSDLSLKRIVPYDDITCYTILKYSIGYIFFVMS